MRIISRLNPVGGIQDFWTEFTRPNPYRWPILGVSVLMTGALLYGFVTQKDYLPPAKPKVTYISTFDPDRTDAEIIASNEANQERKDELAREVAKVEEEKRAIYRELGRASGMDVDKIEAEAAAEREREQAAEKKKHEELMGRTVAESAE